MIKGKEEVRHRSIVLYYTRLVKDGNLNPDITEIVQYTFNIVSDTCHAAPSYSTSDKVFLLLMDRYHNSEQGFEPGSLSECHLTHALNRSATMAGKIAV